MNQAPIKLDISNPIVDSNGYIAPFFQVYLAQLNQAYPLVGQVSPEGNLEAPLYTLYIDASDPNIPIFYRKMLPFIGSDRSLGWKQV